MHKLTVFFVVMVVSLSVALGGALWQLRHVPVAQVAGAINSTALQLGVPGGGDSTTLLFPAASAVLWDTDKESVRFEQGGFERRPIASLTKLMTAIVALDHGMPWDKHMTIELNEFGLGGNLLLHPGEWVTMRDLFSVSLLGSANNATRAYVRGLNISEEDFVREMNRKAVELGLEQTTFTDVTGLDPGNISTAYDVARLAHVAFTRYHEIRDITSQPTYTFNVGGSGRVHSLRNTNKLVAEEGEVITGSKTGYLDEAKWCLVMKGSGEFENRIAVMLGHPSEQSYFTDTRELLRLPAP